MEQPSNRSDRVIDHYRQHKISVSVYAQIKALLMKFEAVDAADRRIAWIGLGITLVVAITLTVYFYSNLSQITLS